MTLCLHCTVPLVQRPSRLTEGRLLWAQATPTLSLPLVCWKRPGAVKDHQPAPSFDEQVEEAVRDVEAAVTDTRGDFPDLGEADRYHEMVVSVTFGRPPAVANEVRRRFGFDPADF